MQKEKLVYRKENILEVCAGSYQDCMAAYLGGAHRVELNSALSVGGLSPSLITLQQVKEATDLEVICMVRCRAGGFFFDEMDFDIMMKEAELFLKNGADGIAFGFLNSDFTVSISKTKKMVDLIHSYGKTAVFHRAFDVTIDPYMAIEQLIECKVDRILTSGQRNKAIEGIDLIKKLNDIYGKDIQILAGSGVNSENAMFLINQTGINQIHSSCKAYKKDPTTYNDYVSYAYLKEPYQDCFDIVDENIVKDILNCINKKNEKG